MGATPVAGGPADPSPAKVTLMPHSSPDELHRRMLQAPPAELDGAAPVQVHSLVSHKHVPLYLFAIKSLAGYWRGVAAVVHDDGSLTDADRALLEEQVPGVRVIRRPDADDMVQAMLGDHPLLAEVRRRNVRILQLVDYFLLGDADLVIGMDSDILFFGEPLEVMRWAAATERQPAFMYSQERFASGRLPGGVRWIPEALPGVPYVPHMCCGFVCAHRRRFLDLDYLEVMMDRTPREILFRPRHVTQMFYSVLGGRLGDAAQPLGEPYRSGPWSRLPPAENRVLCHYFASIESAEVEDNIRRLPELFRRALQQLEGAEQRG